jgi:hypothetical protein
MDLHLQGKTALVTGASQGIGLAVARQFAEEGCQVHLAARSKDKLEAAVAEIRRQTGVQAWSHPCDLTQSASVHALARECGEVDILVNNAGAVPGGALGDLDEERWRAGWELKVFGYINMSREFYRIMSARRRGVIIHVIGIGGERPDFNYIAGAASNAGLMAFSRALGSRSSEDGVRVLAVNPGWIATERMVQILSAKAERELNDPKRWPEFTGSLPFGRAGTAEEVANVVVFMASERASYVSGTVVTVDAGTVLRDSIF